MNIEKLLEKENLTEKQKLKTIKDINKKLVHLGIIKGTHPLTFWRRCYFLMANLQIFLLQIYDYLKAEFLDAYYPWRYKHAIRRLQRLANIREDEVDEKLIRPKPWKVRHAFDYEIKWVVKGTKPHPQPEIQYNPNEDLLKDPYETVNNLSKSLNGFMKKNDKGETK
jgi:hypothetical protein